MSNNPIWYTRQNNQAWNFYKQHKKSTQSSGKLLYNFWQMTPVVIATFCSCEWEVTVVGADIRADKTDGKQFVREWLVAEWHVSVNKRSFWFWGKISVASFGRESWVFLSFCTTNSKNWQENFIFEARTNSRTCRWLFFSRNQFKVDENLILNYFGIEPRKLQTVHF